MSAASQETLSSLWEKQKNFFSTGITKPISFRKTALSRLAQGIRARQSDILAALQTDLHKCEAEARLTELYLIFQEIGHALRHVSHWSRPKWAAPSLSQLPGRSFTQLEPYGTTLILAPWNYPFQLSLVPLIHAIAAGNCAVVKPSEHAPASAQVIQEILKDCFPPAYVTAVPGGRDESSALLDQPFDFIFFTGGETVGRLVLEKAARHLTPVCLELGGKSPCIVDATANVRLAAKRIAFGKVLNAGQTCVAPDYVFVHESVREPFLLWLRRYFQKFTSCPDQYPKIIRPDRFEHLIHLMDTETIFCGGECNAGTLQISPTVLYPVHPDSPVMQEEIFGPLLPVFSFSFLHEAITFIKARPKPLALYLFTRSKRNEQAILNRLSFGGGCINDTILHLASPHTGFGGVGASGMGRYHGKEGMELFSHRKTMLKQSTRADMPLRYPPYGPAKTWIARRMTWGHS